MARRSDHTQEQIKEMVLIAAEGIVTEEGEEALTVRKIAQHIGYTVGSIYMVFTNMQDLLLHINARSLQQLSLQLATVSGQDSPEQGIVALAEAYLEFAGQNFNRWRLIFQPRAKSHASLPVWYREKVESVYAPLESRFKALKPEISQEQAGLAARALWSGVHGVCVFGLEGNPGAAGMDASRLAARLLTENFILGWKQSH